MTDQLPANYTQARSALAECVQIDECKGWADKSMALAAYAKQANDDDLLKMSQRIKARAIDRMGQLFNEIEPQSKAALRQGGASPSGDINGREQAARDAGVSQDQRKQAQRIANMDRDEFERQVESDNPPTITALSDMQRRGSANPAAMRSATNLLGTLKRFADFCEKTDPKEIKPTLAAHEVSALLEHSRIVVAWITTLAGEIE